MRRPSPAPRQCEARPSDRDKIVILGGGPNRIGQGIEFDYCCCHACFALADAGFETIMINCNPETVSTDYDTSDRLYFEPLTGEDVAEILDVETRQRNACRRHRAVWRPDAAEARAWLAQAGVPILGTPVDSIDLAEDRDRFKRLLDKLGLKQPKNGIAYSVEQSRIVAGELGLPLVVRPSYVLGGRAMAIIRDVGALDDYLLGTLPSLVPSEIKTRYPNDKTGQINTVLGKNPLLFDRYLTDAIEVDVDCLRDGENAVIAGVMEHIEEAGIHSGDSACSLPPRSLSPETIAALERQTKSLAKALGVVGLMNVQFALKDGEIYVLEVNPRASRTVPFVAKVIGEPIAKIAARVMAGETLATFDLPSGRTRSCRRQGIGVSLRALPRRRHRARPGNALDRRGHRPRPLLRRRPSPRASSAPAPRCRAGGAVFVSVRDADKPRVLAAIRLLTELGFHVLATGGTARFLQRARHRRRKKSTRSRKGVRISWTRSRTASIQLVFNTTEGAQALADSRSLRQRRSCIRFPITRPWRGRWPPPQGIKAYVSGDLEVRALQDYFA